MFSGKTHELILRVAKAGYAAPATLVVVPSTDRRNGAHVATHLGLQVPATPVDDAAALAHLARTSSVVGIDEAQFFDDALVDVALHLADSGKRVIISGLDLDFRRRPFGCMPQLLCVAAHVQKLQAVCQHCGDAASFTQRLVDGRPAPHTDATIVVGSSELYEARCRTCYSQGAP